jgi:hypothetical protein
MIRAIPVFVAMLVLGSACFGGGDKEPVATATREAVATSVPDREEPTEEPSDDAESREGALGTVFESLLGGGLGGASGSSGSLGAGDPALKELLPAAEDFPAGFAPFGEFTFSSPDGVSADGKIDMAMSMAVSGDVASGNLEGAGFLMAMVMHPEDLQDLGDALSSIDDLEPDEVEAEIRRGIGQAGQFGVGISDVDVFEVTDLGDGGFGMQMTMDMGELLGSLPRQPGAPEVTQMTMRMHIFANGDYIGAVMRMSFTDTLPAGDEELALARAIDAKLTSAP